jgi:hypothetical protein
MMSVSRRYYVEVDGQAALGLRPRAGFAYSSDHNPRRTHRSAAYGWDDYSVMMQLGQAARIAELAKQHFEHLIPTPATEIVHNRQPCRTDPMQRTPSADASGSDEHAYLASLGLAFVEGAQWMCA